MRSRDTDILIIPGLGGSGPDHWQTRWETKLSSARRVVQQDWDRPDRSLWVRRIAEAIEAATRPTVLVAHSLGVLAAAETLLSRGFPKLAGAFLVAPPESARLADIPEVDPAFLDVAAGVLPCPAVVVGSTSDPYASIASVEALANLWDASFLDAGDAGHINEASGHGPWPEGLMAFAGFLNRLAQAH